MNRHWNDVDEHATGTGLASGACCNAYACDKQHAIIMAETSTHLTLEDRAVIDTIRSHHDIQAYDKALTLIDQHLARAFDLTEASDAFIKAELAGWLIDIGDEIGDEHRIQQGVDAIEHDREALAEFVSPASIDYNLGSAKHALFRLRAMRPGFRPSISSVQPLNEAKNHLWRACQMEFSDGNEPPPDMLTNLGFALTASNRFVEAIQWYDRVLKADPSFDPAHFNRSHALMALSFLSENYSANMFAQMMQGFAIAAESQMFPPHVRDQSTRYRDFMVGKLNELGYGQEDMEEEFHQTAEERETHSP
jgi:tetratricopeptide (TPR) repeat protein